MYVYWYVHIDKRCVNVYICVSTYHESELYAYMYAIHVCMHVYVLRYKVRAYMYMCVKAKASMHAHVTRVNNMWCMRKSNSETTNAHKQG